MAASADDIFYSPQWQQFIDTLRSDQREITLTEEVIKSGLAKEEKHWANGKTLTVVGENQKIAYRRRIKQYCELLRANMTITHFTFKAENYLTVEEVEVLKNHSSITHLKLEFTNSKADCDLSKQGELIAEILQNRRLEELHLAPSTDLSDIGVMMLIEPLVKRVNSGNIKFHLHSQHARWVDKKLKDILIGGSSGAPGFFISYRDGDHIVTRDLIAEIKAQRQQERKEALEHQQARDHASALRLQQQFYAGGEPVLPGAGAPPIAPMFAAHVPLAPAAAVPAAAGAVAVPRQARPQAFNELDIALLTKEQQDAEGRRDEATRILINGFCCSITMTPAKNPMLLNGRLYDLSTLEQLLAQGRGRALDPFEHGKYFTKEDIAPAWGVLSNMEEFLKNLRNRQAEQHRPQVEQKGPAAEEQNKPKDKPGSKSKWKFW